ncbi:MAG: nucleotidyltransferase domain-containing protein [Gemmatimonadota bacterium]
MAMTLDELVTQLRAAYGAELACVVLYGSAASGEHVPRKSDYNVLVLLNRISADTLAPASAVAREWKDAGNPPPMTMTVEEWRSSDDIFPMEYADILEGHRVLFGSAPFDGVRISLRFLRLQLESQVMGKLLQLRQGALLAGTDGKRQLELISASFSTIMVLFRAVVRLQGDHPPADNVSLSEQVARLAGFDPSPFTRAANHHRGDARISTTEAGSVLAQYLSGVGQLKAYLDTFLTQESK